MTKITIKEQSHRPIDDEQIAITEQSGRPRGWNKTIKEQSRRPGGWKIALKEQPHRPSKDEQIAIKEQSLYIPTIAQCVIQPSVISSFNKKKSLIVILNNCTGNAMQSPIPWTVQLGSWFFFGVKRHSDNAIQKQKCVLISCLKFVDLKTVSNCRDCSCRVCLQLW